LHRRRQAKSAAGGSDRNGVPDLGFDFNGVTDDMAPFNGCDSIRSLVDAWAAVPQRLV
jgi:hypothetical protein